ncbi:MAG: hypothetical protein FHK82_17730 [Sedimenticola thiotaurini]|uniref:Uncharacterized protein n=1 Tax=Sedimenticola thiotaurini TaxID=1543721 RepID=A0A558CI47_9GAMM|nr:MAG: hypothetical protein FHK82_17730 [Sedimenticola thiotaurini]
MGRASNADLTSGAFFPDGYEIEIVIEVHASKIVEGIVGVAEGLTYGSPAVPDELSGYPLGSSSDQFRARNRANKAALEGLVGDAVSGAAKRAKNSLREEYEIRKNATTGERMVKVTIHSYDTNIHGTYYRHKVVSEEVARSLINK